MGFYCVVEGVVVLCFVVVDDVMVWDDYWYGVGVECVIDCVGGMWVVYVLCEG